MSVLVGVGVGRPAAEHGKVVPPHLIPGAIHEFGETDEGHPAGPSGLAEQVKPHLLHCLVTLLCVALAAAADQILPVPFSPHSSGRHVVDGELADRLTAVLAGVVVAGEDGPAGQAQPGGGALDAVLQTHDGRAFEGRGGGVESDGVLVEDVHLPQTDEPDGSAHIADVDGFVIAIEDQNVLV